jgi:hypothetical protein
MKKTLNIDDTLLQQAREACPGVTDTEIVRQGLQALVRHNAYQQLRTFLGTEPNAVDVPRRREDPAPKGKVHKRRVA